MNVCRCGMGDEYFMLVTSVWEESGASGAPCIGCVERLLGRQLVAADFDQSTPVNFIASGVSSRMRDRTAGLVCSDPERLRHVVAVLYDGVA